MKKKPAPGSKDAGKTCEKCGRKGGFMPEGKCWQCQHHPHHRPAGSR